MEHLLTVIVNHEHNEEGIRLKEHLKDDFNPILMDSGSEISDSESPHFDYQFPNIYYNGLINEAYKLMKSKHTHLFLITSDVEIADPRDLHEKMESSLANPSTGAYAPSASHTTHNHMHNLGSNKTRKVTFTDGFCVVMPKTFLDIICPIDLKVNYIGHGIEIYMGYLGMVNNRPSVVDDRVIVDHPPGKSGYSGKEARIQRDNWFDTKTKKARIFHYWASMDWLKNRTGFICLQLLMKVLGKMKTL
ncbi:MAG: hypothetical protein RIM99_03865 [Cyclobacteriaceae bacterium]